MPFKSEKQRRWMHANEPEMAKRWEKETPKGKKLPEKAAALLSLVREMALRKMGSAADIYFASRPRGGTAQLIDERDNPAEREIDRRNAEFEDSKRMEPDYNLRSPEEWAELAEEQRRHDGVTNMSHGEELNSTLGPDGVDMAWRS